MFCVQDNKTNTNDLKKAISDIPQNKPNESEGLVRKLYGEISNLQDAGVKESLLNELKAVACRGLQKELKTMIERKGLQLEAIYLVVNYLTSIPELAEYLDKNYSQPEVVLEAGLGMINKRLGPDLEVVGRLKGRGVDVSKKWVKNLRKKAPSFQALTRLSLQELEKCCEGADEGEMDEVYRQVEKAESHKTQLAAVPQDGKLIQEDKNRKAVDEEKLTKAKELMNDAKAMAKDRLESSKETVNKKLREIMNTLELPANWFKQDEVKPEQLFQQLEEIIGQYSNVVESPDSYKSEVEIVTRASAGKALCGIYHSEYKPPKSAGRPLLLIPTTVTLTNPNSAQEINHMKFSARGTAAEYVRTIESSSTNIGTGVAGFYGLFVGEVQGGYGHESSSQEDHSVQSSTTGASVLQYIRTAKKTFQLERDQVNLSLTARKMAKAITKDANANAPKREKSARIFMDRYGSHFPAGVQTLGGVFFSIADAESKSTTDTFKLTEAAVDHLNAQISLGFLGGAFGIGASVTGEHTTGSGKTDEKHETSESYRFTYSVKSMGPPATNPSTFHKLLSYNSTWALIDRGSFEGYIPVWELIRDLGKEFEGAASVLEKTWCKDEKARKREWEAQKEKQRKLMQEEERKAKEKLLKEARDDLLKIKEEHLETVRLKSFFMRYIFSLRIG